MLVLGDRDLEVNGRGSDGTWGFLTSLLQLVVGKSDAEQAEHKWKMQLCERVTF